MRPPQAPGEPALPTWTTSPRRSGTSCDPHRPQAAGRCCKQSGAADVAATKMLRSSPGMDGRCCIGPKISLLLTSLLRSSPALGPALPLGAGLVAVLVGVAILASPGGRRCTASIQPGKTVSWLRSSPTLEDWRCRRGRRCSARGPRWDPHQPQKAGAAHTARRARLAQHVAILTDEVRSACPHVAILTGQGRLVLPCVAGPRTRTR